MGYYTSYSLEVLNVENELEIIDNLRKTSEYADHALDDEGNTEEPCKWYEHEEELIEFSKKYPDALFKLSGEGEEAGDIWQTYFKNGKKQNIKAKVTFEDFDENKMN